MMFAVVIVALLVTMALALARACLGPTLYDRILAVNTFGTKTVLLIAAYGFLTERPDFLDIALVYALINFIGTIAVLKFFESGEFAHSWQERRQRVEAGHVGDEDSPWNG